MSEKLQAIIESGIKESNYSNHWFYMGGSVNFVRKIAELRQMCSSFSRASWDKGFEAGVKFAIASKEIQELKENTND